ncbi:hypothetical protein NDU88_004601 [Pleurodeles waltl]|uniref:Uncharacterized protein n=1 Tax=Pleurodeles waltl TaxID=8319 RepID=A0AAV7UFM7_PLEWA|nr:hypothetical protein NDU88_004601 [Pleurodeles waltl]
MRILWGRRRTAQWCPQTLWQSSEGRQSCATEQGLLWGRLDNYVERRGRSWSTATTPVVEAGLLSCPDNPPGRRRRAQWCLRALKKSSGRKRGCDTE